MKEEGYVKKMVAYFEAIGFLAMVTKYKGKRNKTFQNISNIDMYLRAITALVH